MAEALSLKDAKLQRYYDALFEMHGSEGWRELMVDVEYMETEHNKLDTITTVEELHFRKGQLDMLRWFRTHRDRIEAAYTHILNEEHGEGSAPDATGGIAKVIE